MGMGKLDLDLQYRFLLRRLISEFSDAYAGDRCSVCLSQMLVWGRDRSAGSTAYAGPRQDSIPAEREASVVRTDDVLDYTIRLGL